MVVSLLYLAPFLTTSVLALNDWSQPCLSGTCSYDLLAPDGASSGSISVWGSDNLLTDVTSAAGWTILGCSPDATSQSIRLVCNGNDPASAGCSHLYQNNGAVNKIVRLPEACGSNAFARVARSYTPQDQSIPASLAPSLQRRDGSLPQVRGLDLDTDFSKIDASSAGTLGFAIQGLNSANFANKSIPVPAPSTRQRRSPYAARQLGNFPADIGDFLKEALGALTQEFDINQSIPVPPIKLDENFNLIDVSADCKDAGASGNLKVDVGAKGNVAANIGVVAVGTIIPPEIKNLNFVTNMDADIAGTVDMKAGATGTFDTGAITLFEVGIPGLDFPGLFKLGPTFQINTQLKASIDAQTDVAVGLNFQAKNATIAFPPDAKAADNSTDLGVGDTQFDLSVSPAVQAKGTVEAHLIPTINLGVTLLDTVNAEAFVNLDGGAILTLGLEASKNGGNNTDINNEQNGSSSSSSESSTSSDSKSSTSADFKSSTADSKASSTKASDSTMTSATSASETTSSKASMTTSSSAAAMMHQRRFARRALYLRAEPDSASSTSSAEASSTASAKDSKTTSASSTTTSSSAEASQSSTDNGKGSDNKGNGGAAGAGNDAQFGGCVDMKLDFSVNVGANADALGGIFSVDDNKTLFEKQFQLFQKCFGDATAADKQKVDPAKMAAIRKLMAADPPVLRRLRFSREQPAPKMDAPKAGPVEAADPPKAEPSKADPPKAEPSKADPPKAEPSKVDPPKAEPSKAADPKADPPKADPKADPPKADPPKADPPKADPPKADPKADPPKADPKADPPKADDPKKVDTKVDVSDLLCAADAGLGDPVSIVSNLFKAADILAAALK